MKVLLTGATGFIGSNIALKLIESEFEVYATHRTTSSFTKCAQFRHKIKWINTDILEWKEQLRTIKPEVLIHTAWGGIEAGDRNNWDIQIRNFWFSKELFDLASECSVKKVISLGSQAEYGIYGFPVDETTAPMPNDAYGSVKTLTANYLRNLFEYTKTEWYWIRVFSVFGEGENPNWLIPTVISKLLKNVPVELTACEQKYDYLYIKDFCNQLLCVINSKTNNSGIFNICNSKSNAIKELLRELASLMKVSNNLLQFGHIPYRQRQNMLIAGDNTKFKNAFKYYKDTYGISKGLLNTIEYHKNN